MDKNNYLTKQEQKVWYYIKDKAIIDNELIKIIFPEMGTNKRNKILHSLYKKGYIKRAIRDLYYSENLNSFYELALKIHEGYIGLTSALKYYDLIDYEDFTIIIITKNLYKKINIGKYEIKYLPLKKYYNNFKKQNKIKVSTLEKTFFDCFLRDKYLSYSLLTKALYNTEEINWKEFIKLVNQGPISLKQKIGYILEILKKETDFNMPNYVLKEFNKNIKTPLKLKSNNKKTKFNHKWKIQSNLTKKEILNWWYN